MESDGKNMKVAFLGLGIMGKPMAANLVKAGNEVTTWNRTPGKAVEGAKSASSPKDAAAGADAVWVCVSDTEAVEAVLFGASGAVPSLRAGATVIDSSTIAPEASVAFAEKVRAAGCEFIDAPVTGSKIGAEAGTLIFIAGGTAPAIAAMQPLFSAMGKQVIHMGGNGKGLAAKLSMNLMIALIYQGFAEALTLAEKLGVEQKQLFDLIQSSMVRSGVVEYKMPFVANRDYTPNFPLRLMRKDIRLMLEAAKGAGVPLPALETVKAIYDDAANSGMADKDYAAVLELLRGRVKA